MRALILILLCSFGMQSQDNIDLKKAEILYDEAKESYYDGDYDVAVEKFDTCIVLRKKHLSSPHLLIIKAEHRLGIAATKSRDYPRAEEYLKLALNEAESLDGKGSDLVARIMGDIAVLYSRKGLYSKSIEWNEKTMEIRRRLYGKGSKEVAYTRMNNAQNFYSLGNYSKCISQFYEVLKIYNQHLEPDDQNYNRVYLTMANAYRKKGDLTSAEKFSRKALEIKLLNYDEKHHSVAKYYENLARALVALNRINEAEEYFEKARVIVESMGDRRDIGAFVNDAARIYLANGEIEKALEEFQEAEKILLPYEDKVLTARYNITTCLYALGREDEAISILRQIMEKEKGTDHMLRLSSWSRKAGNLDDAFKYLDQGKKLISDGDELTKIEFLVEEAKINSEIDIEESWQLINKAITTLTHLRKRYSGRDSKDFINDELEGIFDLAVEIGLERYEKNRRSTETFEELYVIVEQAKAASFWDNLSEDNANYYGGVPSSLLEEIEILREGNVEDKLLLEEKLSYLEENYNDYYRMKYSLEVPALIELQDKLDPNMMVIDYYMLEESTIALLIGHKDFYLVTYENKESFNFNDELVMIPEAVERISIIPHKTLHFISFDELKNPSTEEFLLYDYAFSYQLNVQGLLKNVDHQNQNSYLGFVPSWGESNGELLASRDELIPLPGAKLEVAEVSQLFGGDILEATNATESRFYESASKYDILHFATHARVDPDNELNSVLFLKDDDEKSDGLLEMDEIMNTDLNADLVILSACETGAGGLKSGEGVMSLARAFQYSGAESVLMSLWRANDQSSHPIILEFLKNYKNGMTKDVALQQSKIQYIAEADPLLRGEFYWAGFMVSGNLDQYQKRTAYLYYLLILGGTILLIFTLTRLYKFS